MQKLLSYSVFLASMFCGVAYADGQHVIKHYGNVTFDLYGFDHTTDAGIGTPLQNIASDTRLLECADGEAQFVKQMPPSIIAKLPSPFTVQIDMSKVSSKSTNQKTAFNWMQLEGGGNYIYLRTEYSDSSCTDHLSFNTDQPKNSKEKNALDAMTASVDAFRADLQAMVQANSANAKNAKGKNQRTIATEKSN